ncbi:MAG: MATE family efflux transporter, partial [Anaerolineae bacterium]|nr:MATE family efflux transporter [Anaerolineae bacterium]
LWPQLKTMVEIIRQGLPNIVDLGSVSIGFFVLTFFVSRFGQEAVAAFGAAARIEQLALLPIIGLDVATLSLIAQNNGAGLPRRVNETLATAIRYGVIIMLIGGTLITIFAVSLMGLFSDDPDIISIGTTYIRIRAWALIPTAFTFLPFSAMRGLKKPLHALFLNLNRTVILPIIGILVMVQLLGFGLVAIWWVTFVVAFLIAAIAYIHARRLLPAP